MAESEHGCLHDSLLTGSSGHPHLLGLAHRMRAHGIRWTAAHVLLRCRRLLPRNGETSPATPPRAACEHLGLEPGELVEVKSHEEILATLDVQGKCRGLAFSRGMERYCGERRRVFKRVERIFLEHSSEFRNLRDTVLLESVHCDGQGYRCDMSCFYFWRESWLRRADGSGPGSQS